MGGFELQVFVGLIVVLGAAFVALICDFLKGNNEQLRESNIELRVRQEERDKRDILIDKVRIQTLEAAVSKLAVDQEASPAAAVQAKQPASSPNPNALWASDLVGHVNAPFHAANSPVSGATEVVVRTLFHGHAQPPQQAQAPLQTVVEVTDRGFVGEPPRAEGAPLELPEPVFEPITFFDDNPRQPELLRTESALTPGLSLGPELHSAPEPAAVLEVLPQPVDSIDEVVESPAPVEVPEEIELVFEEEEEVVEEAEAPAEAGLLRIPSVVQDSQPVVPFREVEPAAVWPAERAGQAFDTLESSPWPPVDLAPPAAGLAPLALHPAPVETVANTAFAAPSHFGYDRNLVTPPPPSPMGPARSSIEDEAEPPMQALQPVALRPVIAPWRILEWTSEILNAKAVAATIPERTGQRSQVPGLSVAGLLPVSLRPKGGSGDVSLEIAPIAWQQSRAFPVSRAVPLDARETMEIPEAPLVLLTGLEPASIGAAPRDCAAEPVTPQWNQAAPRCSFEPAPAAPSLGSLMVPRAPRTSYPAGNQREIVAGPMPIAPAAALIPLHQACTSAPDLPASDAILDAVRVRVLDTDAPEPAGLELNALLEAVLPESHLQIVPEPSISAPLVEEPEPEKASEILEFLGPIVAAPLLRSAASAEPPTPGVIELPGPYVPKLRDSLLPKARLLDVPAGAHPASVFERLLASAEPFSGTVLIVQATDLQKTRTEQGSEEAERISQTLLQLAEALAGERDFLCQVMDDEVIVACPRLVGGAAQARLQQVAELVWDFQLRSFGSVPFIASWGSGEVVAGSFRQAVEEARERMIESQRSRRGASTGAGRFRRIFVA